MVLDATAYFWCVRNTTGQQERLLAVATANQRIFCSVEAGPFNEMIVMGVLAVRLQGLHRTLKWDGNNMQFTNIGDNEMIKTCIKDGFTIKDGHPSFAKDWTDPVNAKQYAAEMIKHNYRQGWKLPDMPR